jgi:hypothetical protein
MITLEVLKEIERTSIFVFVAVHLSLFLYLSSIVLCVMARLADDGEALCPYR